MTKTEYFSEPSKFFDLVTNPNKIVKNVDICRENLLLVNWEDTEPNVEPHACSNVIVAAFVTAQARLKLYEPLEKLNERVLYFDTDSIIYHHKVSKGAKIRNRYNQVPHLTQDTNGKVTNSQ